MNKKLFQFLALFILLLFTPNFIGQSRTNELSYPDYTSFVADMQGLEDDHPDIAKLENLGSTFRGNDIWAIKISDNAQSNEDEEENKVLFIGLHHAREWISLEVPYLLAEHLLDNYNNPDIKPLVDNLEIWIIPMLNPDGYIYTRSDDDDWRKNRRPIPKDLWPDCQGVDLNRNYGTNAWGTIDNDYCSQECVTQYWNLIIPRFHEYETYIGPSPFSELETKAVRDFFENEKRRPDAVLSYHSSGQQILYPWGYTTDPIEDPWDKDFLPLLATNMRDAIRNAPGEIYVAMQASLLYSEPEKGKIVVIAGDLNDWGYEKYGIPSFTIELRSVPKMKDGSIPDELEFYGTVEENLEAAKILLTTYLPNIENPTQNIPAQAGFPSNPTKISITLAGIGKGRTKDDFQIRIGGLPGEITSVARIDTNKYVLGVLPPKQTANGEYDLEVIMGGSSTFQPKSVSYGGPSNADVMLVIDKSGSMGYSQYIDPAKTAAKQFIDFMNLNDKVGVVSFNNSATLNYQLTDILNDNIKSQAKAQVDNIYASGNTSIGAGLQVAQDQLVKSGDPHHPWAIVLLSDGYENTAPMVSTVLPTIFSSKTKVHTIALGPDSDQSLLLNIGSQLKELILTFQEVIN